MSPVWGQTAGGAAPAPGVAPTVVEDTEPAKAEQVDLSREITQVPPAPVVAPPAPALKRIIGRDFANPSQGLPGLAPVPLHTPVNDPPYSSAVKPAIDLSADFDIVGPPRPLVLLGSEVGWGMATRLSWSPRVSFAGIESPRPVLVVNGATPGETLCLTAAIHGDELNGIEIVRRVMYDIDADKLIGTVIGLPIVNLQGFQRSSRYLPDRRDLNRYFPGNAHGSLASRIAHSLFTQVIQYCDALVDLHTASFYRTNLPQVRADMGNPEVARFSEHFDQMVIVHNRGGDGTLRRAATEYGIPAVTLEIGEPMRLDEELVSIGVDNIMALLDRMGMYEQLFIWGKPKPVYYKSRWVRAQQGGILFSSVTLGDKVVEGEVLGTITSPVTNQRLVIESPYSGRVIGMAVNQVVMPGFAAFHIGIAASEEKVVEEATREAGAEPDPDADNDGEVRGDDSLGDDMPE